ncbi:hypothetical protein NC981_10255 [Leptolyngbya sp. DQ-M1]|uniref:hypothetical protein n=1 Tax=Leptolyngbya sp. DQ-M1 TaxID=2933920 RepID=UPI003297E60D
MHQTTTNTARILVLEPDDNARPMLKHNLQAWGWQVMMALDAEDAIQRTQGGQDCFDLILINQMNQTIDECRAIGQQIRQNSGVDSRAPIIIMAERYGADLEGQDIEIGDHEYVSYLEDGQQLKRLLQRLCSVY